MWGSACNCVIYGIAMVVSIINLRAHKRARIYLPVLMLVTGLMSTFTVLLLSCMPYIASQMYERTCYLLIFSQHMILFQLSSLLSFFIQWRFPSITFTLSSVECCARSFSSSSPYSTSQQSFSTCPNFPISDYLCTLFQQDIKTD